MKISYYKKGKDPWTVEQLDIETMNFAKTLPNLHFLNCKSWVHPSGEVTFHGCTLWSYIPSELQDEVEMSMNDYNLIYTFDNIPGKEKTKRRITSWDTNRWHAEQLEWLKHSIETSKTPKNVVITHHMPSYDMTPERYKGNNVNCAFSTDLNKFIEEHPKINAWVCGHSHDVKQMKIGKTQIYEYCIGYFFGPSGTKYDSVFSV